MLRYLFVLLSVYLFCATLSANPIKVLFLGHASTQHNSRVNHWKLIPQFLRSGIEMTYSENLEDMNSVTLEKYDALIMYANYLTCTPEQEKALISYVENGGGFVPLHCASWCFANSPAFTELVGARFSRHNTGWFTTKFSEGKETHESLGGIKEFETWDETYVHKDFNPDRTDLQFRVEGDKKEPWTWVRTQGEGRVFYTAYGHDGPVWENINFHQLVAAGTIWASGKKNVTPVRSLPEFKYVEDEEGYLTNYENRKVRHKRQLPLTPEDSAKCSVLPPGFEAQLFVSEPHIINPIDMAWDDRGRLFVAETLDYPNDMQELGKGNDRITICEDTVGDGKADKFTVFADRLSIPTSICISDGGLIVAHAPVFLFLKDIDGDDKADVIKEISNGWSIGDTHAGPSNLTYGLDNKIYGAIGYSGGPNGVQSGIFTMNPDGSNVEPLTNFNNNTWGLGLSEDFEVFGSTANLNPAFHTAIPYHYYDKAGIPRKPANLIFDSATFFPMIATRQVDFHGLYTAGAGFGIYTARTYPEKYWNRAGLIGGPTGRLLGQFFIEPNGASYKAINGQNLFASFDQYTSPIQAKTGPDGQVWMLDWSNLIIQHTPIPSLNKGGFDSRRGKGNAHWNPLRDQKHGRIYRIVYKGGEPSKTLDLSKSDSKALVAALKNDNMFWRITAQRKLVQEKRTDAIPMLIELAKDDSVDEIELNSSVVHALWSLHGLGALDGKNNEALAVAVAALKHKSSGVRKNAVKVLPDTKAAVSAVVSSGILDESDPNTLRNVYLKISEMPESSHVGRVLFSNRNEAAKDVWLKDAWAIAMSKHGGDIGLDEIIASLPARNRSKEKSVAGTNANNLFPNPSFEQVHKGLPKGWESKIYGGNAKFEVDSAVARTGKNSVYISSEKGSDAGVKVYVKLTPGKYELSGWVKTKNLRTTGNAKGALFNIGPEGEGGISGENLTRAAKGTLNDWRRLTCTFSVVAEFHHGQPSMRKTTRIGINCRFGGWGQATGQAWYDDVELIKISSSKGGAVTKSIESLLAQQFFAKNPGEIVNTVEALLSIEAKSAAEILSELSPLKAKLSADDITRLKKAAADTATENQSFLAEFAKNSGIDLGLAAAQTKAFEAVILKGNAARGKSLLVTCIGCHGTDLNGDVGRKSPALASQNAWHLITQMQKYKHGIRGGDASDVNAIAMRDIASKLSDQQMADIAAHIKKNFKGKQHKPTLGGNAAKGKQLFATCVACHGTEGQGNVQIKSPKLTGLSDWYVVEALKKFKSGKRGSTKGDVQGKLMQTSVQQFIKDEQDMKDLAAFLNTLKP